MRLDRDLRRRLWRAREALETEASISVADAARAAGVSPFHFIRVFQAAFGVTPHQLHVGARLDRARRLLAGGGLSVTEVCLEVGFSSVGSFSALFRRRVGETPSGYARRVRVVAQVPDGLRRVFAPGCYGLLAHLPPAAFRNFEEA